MKISDVAILSLLSFGTGSAARSSRFRVQDDESDPISERSRVTAFVLTDEGPKVQCWEIGEFLPDASGAKGSGRGVQLFRSEKPEVTLFSWGPGATLFDMNQSGLKTSAFNIASAPRLFTVKDGLILITTSGEVQDGVRTSDDNTQNYVYADINGDDWFYFEDTTTYDDEECDKSHVKRKAGAGGITAETAGGSDTTVISFQHEKRPSHKVLHDGACNFAGLKPSQIKNLD